MTQPNSFESIKLSVGGTESMMLSAPALRVWMILSAPPPDATRKHTGKARQQCVDDASCLKIANKW
jgi:hypothetical protein